MAPAVSPNEADRLAALHRLEILDTLPEQAYDDLTILASELCGTPIAILALRDADRQWYKAKTGTDLVETALNVAFCTHAIERPDEIMIVPDAALDPRFADNPLVTGEPHVRFYAGAPVVLAGGSAVGTVCVADTRPRTLTDRQRRGLAALARQASQLLDLREQAVAAAGRAREHERTSGDATLKQKRGLELLELVLCGNRMGLWDLHVPSGVWIVNAREQALLGYAGVDVSSQPLDLRTMVHPDDRAVMTAAMEPHARGRTAFYECTHRMRHADGHYLWVQNRGVIVERDVRGEAVRIVGTHVDVSDAKRQEDAQRRDAERLQLALAGGDHGLWDWDVPSGRVVRNAAWARMFGYTVEETQGDEEADGLWRSICHPDDRERSEVEMARHFAGLTPMFEAEVRMRHKDGRVLWVLDRAKLVERDADGRPLRVVGTNMNITERKSSALALERANDLLVRTGEMARVGGWSIDVDDGAVTWTDQVYRIHDLDPETTHEPPRALDFLDAASRPILQAAIDAAIADGTPWDLELSLLTARGRPVWIRTHGTADRRGGRVVSLYGTVQDITERKKADLRRIESEKRLRGITDNMPVLIAELAADGRFRFVNRTYESWLGTDGAAMIGRPISDFITSGEYAGRREYLERAQRGATVSFEQTLLLPVGLRCLQTTYLPHFDAGGAVDGIYALSTDITEMKETQRKLDTLARFDLLTGLANRRQFEERLAEAMARTRRSGQPMAILYLDIDRFKSINDTCGHAAGDGVLVEFGERLAASVRETDLVARHAGDEFVVVVEGVTDEAEARAVADKLVVAMHRPFHVTGRPVDVTTSVGVALFAGGPADLAALLSLADEALYDAKARGRNRVSIATTA